MIKILKKFLRFIGILFLIIIVIGIYYQGMPSKDKPIRYKSLWKINREIKK